MDDEDQGGDGAADGLGQQPSIRPYGPDQGITYGYGDQSSYQTQLRATYGDNPLFAMGGFGGGGGGYGPQGGIAGIGSQIAPMRYTAPAFVVTGYSGRFAQQTGITADVKNLVGLGPNIRGSRDYDITRNAAGDLGERVGLGVGGAGLSLLEGAVGSVASDALGFIPGIGAYLLAGKFTDQVRQAVSERREVEGYLANNSDRFFSTSARGDEVDPRRGTGMSTKARQDVAEYMRGLDVADPMMTMQDLTRVLKSSTEAGLFTGTASVDDFKKKFKDIVENVKVVATTLHQTLEEGVKTMQDLRSLGIDPSQARGVVLNAESLGRAAGRSAGEMMNLGMQGGELFRGTGVSMQIGFQSNMMNAASIRAMRDAGLISQETIAQAGGEDALSQRLTATSLGFSQSSFGRGVAGAYFGGAGADASGFNQGSFEKMMHGGMNVDQMYGAVAQGFGTPGSIVKYEAHQTEIASEVGKAYGGQGQQLAMLVAAMPHAKMLADTTGASVEDSLKNVLMKEMNVPEEAANTLIASIKGSQQIFESKQRSIQQTMNDQLIQVANQNAVTSRSFSQLGDYYKATFIDPLVRPFDKFVNNTMETAYTFNEEHLNGIRRADTTGLGNEAYAGRATPADVAKAASGSARFKRTGDDGRSKLEDVNIDYGLFQSVGGDILSALRNKSPNSIYNLDVVSRAPNEGSDNVHNVVLGRDHDGYVKATTSESLEKAARIAAVTQMTELEAKAMEKNGVLENILPEVKQKIADHYNNGRATPYADLNAITKDIFGKDLSELTKGSAEYASLILAVDKMPIYKQMLDDNRKEGDAYVMGVGAVNVESERSAIDRANEAKGKISDYFLKPTDMQKAGITAYEPLSTGIVTQLSEIARLGPKELAKTKEQKDAIGSVEKAFRLAMVDAGMPEMTSEFLQKARAGRFSTRGLAPALMQFDEAEVEIQARQQAYGNRYLMGALRSQIYGTDAHKWSIPDAKQVEDIVAKVTEGGAEEVMKLGDLSSSAKETLRRTGVGANLLSEQEHMAVLKGKLKDHMTRDQVTAQLGGVGDPERIKRLTDAYMQGGGSTNALLNTYHAEIVQQDAATSHLIAPGASGQVNSALGSPEEAAAVQTSVNQAVLSVMQSLADQLRTKPGARP